MSVVLSAAMERAQSALNGGDYRGAVETCNRIVAQFPTFAAAYRLLGEAQLEQGQSAAAEHAFAQVLTRDPCQPEAYLGLGLIAEERGVLESSLAYCQVAWELAPQQPQYREPVVRVAGRRFGGDGYLQLTHAALAQLHLNSARLHRAASEYQTALAELPDRVDLWLGLATAFWRLGQDNDAIEIAREFLKEHPELGQALVIAADVEYRTGNDAEARLLLERLRRVDVDGCLVAGMVSGNPHAAAEFMLLSAESVPLLEERAEPAVAEMPQIAPAPDFSYQPPTPKAPESGAGVAAAGLAGGMLAGLAREAGDESEPATELDAELAGLTPMTAEEFGGEPEEAFSFSLEDTSVEPFALNDFISADAQATAPMDDVIAGIAMELQRAEASADAATDDTDLSDLAAAFDDLEPISVEEFGGFADAGFEDDSSIDEQSATLTTAADEDELSELARALEGDVAEALERAGEPVDDAQPATGFTTILNELGDEGLTPFDPSQQSSAATLPGEAGAGAGDELAKLTEGWDDLDAEIASAVPTSTGQTDELLAMHELGVEPFRLEELGTDELAGYAPSAGMAPSLPRSTPVEEPAAVEPEGGAESFPTALDALEPSEAPEDAYLAGIEPFSADEFDDLASGDFSFGKLPWETDSDDTALPSDADLDAMLADVSLDELGDDDLALVDRDALTAALETGDIELAADPQPEALGDVPDLEAVELGASFQLPPYGDDDELDASLAVTRELGVSPPSEDDFAARLAAMEVAAALSLEQLHDDHSADPEHETVSATDVFRKTDASALAGDKDLFDRSRVAKDELVTEGVIAGDLELTPVLEYAAEHTTQPAEPESEPAQGSLAPSRSVDTLRLSLQAAPDDEELHWWLAEALRERGDTRDALAEYRWLIRHAAHRHEQVIGALLACVEKEPELAHRLLSDAYRRHGDTAKASAHAAQAMAERRRQR